MISGENLFEVCQSLQDTLAHSVGFKEDVRIETLVVVLFVPRPLADRREGGGRHTLRAQKTRVALIAEHLLQKHKLCSRDSGFSGRRFETGALQRLYQGAPEAIR